MALAAAWGGSFLFQRVALPALGAIGVAEGRSLFAGLALLVYAGAARRMPRFTRPLRCYLILGAFGAAGQWAFMALATDELGAALTSIVFATVPLLSVSVAYA